jgi:hypothetical protein
LGFLNLRTSESQIYEHDDHINTHKPSLSFAKPHPISQFLAFQTFQTRPTMLQRAMPDHIVVSALLWERANSGPGIQEKVDAASVEQMTSQTNCFIIISP